MTDIFENMNRQKTIVFVTSQSMAEKPSIINELKDSGRILQVVEMDPTISVANGKAPQTRNTLKMFSDKSHFACSNHITIVQNAKEGEIVEAATEMGMKVFASEGLDAEAVIEHAYKGGASYGI